MSGPLLLRCTALTCYTPHDPWAWGERDEASPAQTQLGTACFAIEITEPLKLGGNIAQRPLMSFR